MMPSNKLRETTQDEKVVSEREAFMKKRGMLTMVLASAMAVSSLAAIPAMADETSASSLDIYGGLTPMEDADDPITYTIFVRDPGVAPADDNPVIKKIQELTGVTLKFEYLVGDLDQKLGVMIAGGDYPDAIFAGDAATKLMDAGAFIPLEDEIPKYENLNAMYSQVMDYLTQEDGHMYNMEIYGTMKNDVTKNAPGFECGLGFFVQKAVLEEAGYPQIHTVDEYFQIIEDYMADNGIEAEGSVDGWTHEQMADYIEEHKIACPTCGKHNFTEIREFNLMFKTFQGVTEDAKNTVYLRPETAQGIFVNFKNVQRTSRKKIPFGIGQVGKSFRNEITPGNFTFRTREFEQMELEFFCEPGTDLEWFQYWRAFCRDWLLSLGIKEDEMRLRDHSPEELCFYSKGTTDIEFYSHLDGANFGVLLTEQIMTLHSIRNFQNRI